ncbi:phosphoribosylanthranilate isomerase [Paenibacillus rigui]|uniref:N-(5'-phosphoribosyl)anthranilate isomerase n=1 Tax=Paenibacillus rigui TaxID=554312 RepID=A0A229UYM4_9BACL|nr:phosphoribosylanthranilate isomerase [Paenibacillus rigui]OXM88059.1 N-(5'-phosphoribosyl)anthranilate isomerase [Paenibacillus rigui]
MGTTRVKICGLRDPELVRAILHLPIDYIGFVFAKSKRQVTPQQTAEMIRVMEERRESGEQTPLSVGVFVDPSREELQALMQVAKLDVIQLHSHESAELCAWIKNTFPGVQVWKVISVVQAKAANGGNVSPAEANAGNAHEQHAIASVLEPYKHTVDAILLDTFDPVYGGGSGKTFAWDTIPPYQQWCRNAGIQLLVAGGLEADNVWELVQAYAPDGVDVSSGVETNGVKDTMKITSFVERVKQQ